LPGLGASRPSGLGEVARVLRQDRFAFYIQRSPTDNRRDVRVITMRNGVKYIRTRRDKNPLNNLLALPEAPRDL